MECIICLKYLQTKPQIDICQKCISKINKVISPYTMLEILERQWVKTKLASKGLFKELINEYDKNSKYMRNEIYSLNERIKILEKMR
tara:strand:+ start:39 stop:299 length:261 start_codon:yes stop_codon:yes gene_type:complete